MMKCQKIIETLKVVTEPYLESRILKQPIRKHIKTASKCIFSPCIIQFDNKISSKVIIWFLPLVSNGAIAFHSRCCCILLIFGMFLVHFKTNLIFLGCFSICKQFELHSFLMRFLICCPAGRNRSWTLKTPSFFTSLPGPKLESLACPPFAWR